MKTYSSKPCLDGQRVAIITHGDETWHLLDTMPLRAAPASFLLGADGELELAFLHGAVATYWKGAIR